MPHVLSPVEARPATEPGALPHFACKCSCGHVVRSTIEINVAGEANAHVAYMTRKEGKA